jgi:AmiR/NasT family two-component response regulator
MRVWLVDEHQGESAAALEAVLRQLSERAGSPITLLGCGPPRPGLAAELRGWQLDVLVVRAACWPEDSEGQALLDLDLGVVVLAGENGCERFCGLAESYPLSFVAAPCQAPELWPALLTALAARRRHVDGKAALTRLQQRLADRIVVERAKGILVQRLGITEEDAYKRMRVISRRQRRQMRDIAQSLLDAESLLLPEVNGFSENGELEGRKPTAG